MRIFIFFSYIYCSGLAHIKVIIIICIISTYKIGANSKNQSTLTTQKKESKISTINYVYLEPIAEKLNKKENKLNLYKNFSSYGLSYAPLYTLTKDYTYSTKTNTGEIIAVSKYVQGTYKIKGDLLVDVLIIQDKTFENGGFIYMNDDTSKYALYKYKESYLIFKYNYDLLDKEKNKNTSDFIKAFYNEYSNLYETSEKS